MKPAQLLAISTLLSACVPASALDNGLALTPPMGFNTWNTFKTNPTEKVVKEIADAMVARGLKDAGYVYVNIDDFYNKGRDEEGNIIVDEEKFPSGMKAMADYIHSKGLKAGIYTDIGPSKKNSLGSYGFYKQDATTFADWGYDFLKVDVNKKKDNLEALFTEFSEAVLKTGRPMVFSICTQGLGDFQDWAPAVGNLWRVGKDIDYCRWEKPLQSTQWEGVMYQLDLATKFAELAKPGAWNDADMMLIGVPKDKKLPLKLLNDIEARSHFSLWCMINSPLIIGADLRTCSDEVISILTNREVIALNQDKLGQQARLVSDADGLQVYSKVLVSESSGRRGVALLNRSEVPQEMSVDAETIGLTGEFEARDLWEHKNLGRFSRYSVMVPPHGVALLLVQQVKK